MICRLSSDVEHYKWIEYQDIEAYERQPGQTLKASWKPLKLNYIPDRKAKAGDCLHFTAGLPVFSEMAVTVLKPVIGDEAEFLDIEIKNERRKFFLVNVPNILDCLDYDHSTIKWFSCGRITDIPIHVFFEEKTAGSAIFKLPDHGNEIFVTDKFVVAVENSTLEGFCFQELPEEDENPFEILLRPKKRRGKNIWR